MIVVELRDGRSVEVEGGKRAVYSRETKHVSVEEVIVTTLEITDKDGYGGKLLASFKADEVVFFHIEEDKKDEEKPDDS